MLSSMLKLLVISLLLVTASVPTMLSLPERGSEVPLCLIKNVYHEARGESFEGMVAVAQVTLNRSKGDICKAVYAKKQFSWTAKERPMTDNQAYQLAIEAVRVVLEGRAEIFLRKNLHLATHYHNTSVNPVWNRKMRKIAKVGNHIFYVG